jgi:catalase (peroxidase I)
MSTKRTPRKSRAPRRARREWTWCSVPMAEKFGRDFVVAWNKVMTADRYDLRA